MHALICAAGSQRRWEESGGRGLKQLIEIDGEPVIRRLYRLAAPYCEQLTTLVRDPSLEAWAGLNPKPPASEPWMGEMGKFLDGKPYWPAAGEVTILYGDAYYTEAAIAAIFGHKTSQPTVFGRARARRSESFAFRFTVPDHVAEVERVARECADAGLVDRGGPWRWFLRRHVAIDRYTKQERRMVTGLATEENGWVEVGHDATDDFDRLEDLERWQTAHRPPRKGAVMTFYAKRDLFSGSGPTRRLIARKGQPIKDHLLDLVAEEDRVASAPSVRRVRVPSAPEVASASASPAPAETTPADPGSGEPGASGSGDAEPTVDATAGALKLAKKHDVDLATVEGSGANGRITADDVKKALKG